MTSLYKRPCRRTFVQATLVFHDLYMLPEKSHIFRPLSYDQFLHEREFLHKKRLYRVFIILTVHTHFPTLASVI